MSTPSLKLNPKWHKSLYNKGLRRAAPASHPKPLRDKDLGQMLVKKRNAGGLHPGTVSRDYETNQSRPRRGLQLSDILFVPLHVRY